MATRVAFPSLCSTAFSKALKRVALRRRILGDERTNTLVQRPKRLDFDLGQRRMVEPREEHNAHRVALIPRLVLEGIVEDDAVPLTPVARLVSHTNPAAFGHDEPEVGGEEHV